MSDLVALYHGTSHFLWLVIEYQGALRPSVWDMRADPDRAIIRIGHPRGEVHFTPDPMLAAVYAGKPIDERLPSPIPGTGGRWALDRGLARQDGVIRRADLPRDELRDTGERHSHGEFRYPRAVPATLLRVVAYVRKGQHVYRELERAAPAPAATEADRAQLAKVGRDQPLMLAGPVHSTPADLHRGIASIRYRGIFG